MKFLRKFVIVFFDDILIYSKDRKEHLAHLTMVLAVLQKHSLFAKRSKCRFACKQIDYLGHLVLAEGVQADPSKIKAMVEWPQPKSVKSLRRFLGLIGYYRKFVKHYGLIASPLTDLLRKDGFKWGPDATQAFEELKKAITQPPVLALPDFTKPFLIECNASGKGIGAVLMQAGRPLAFLSQPLRGQALALSAYEKEFLAFWL